MLRVLRWNRRTPSRSSSRAIALPTADEEMPSLRPATVKLRVSAASTKVLSAVNLSIVSILRSRTVIYRILDGGVRNVRSRPRIIRAALRGYIQVRMGRRTAPQRGHRIMDIIRVGIIGVGNWARHGHLRVLDLLPQYRVVAVQARRREAAEAAAAEFAIEHVVE